MADITTTRIFTDGEKGITANKLNDIVGSSVIQPAFYSAKPTTSTLGATDQMLALLSTGFYAVAPFQTVINSVSAALNSDQEIWSVRLRSFNAVGNPNFEVDQRQCGALFTGTSYGSVLKVIDRWNAQETGTSLDLNTQQVSANVVVPGTSQLITQKIFRVTLTGQQASLGAGHYMILQSVVEGPTLRELINDVHSVSLLVRSSVANLKFGLILQSVNGAYTLSKLCSLGTANTWTLITLPNLPVWTASGTWSLTPGVAGYNLIVSLAAGSTYTTVANDTWQASATFGAIGQSNFAGSPVNSTFDIAMVQHEPGPVCSTLMDKPFAGTNGNLEECLRYYQKSYPFATVSATAVGSPIYFYNAAGAHPYNAISFRKIMAKAPTLTAYSPTGGSPGFVRNMTAPADIAISGPVNPTDNGFGGFSCTAAPPASQWVSSFHYTADTGW